jgi:DNA-binding NarL/FixJ family response regulator
MAGLESMPKIRIIIVEKHMGVRRALRKRLSATPHLEVVAAFQEPSAALSYLTDPVNHGNGRVGNVVLIGLQNGPDEELFKTLKTIEQIARLPAAVIALAPYADEVERLLLQQAGVFSYLLKYIDSGRLIQVIETAAQRGLSPAASPI